MDLDNIVKKSAKSTDTSFDDYLDSALVTTQDGKVVRVTRLAQTNWTPMRIYEYERIKNENNREILLVDESYKDRIVKQFKELMRK